MYRTETDNERPVIYLHYMGKFTALQRAAGGVGGFHSSQTSEENRFSRQKCWRGVGGGGSYPLTVQARNIGHCQEKEQEVYQLPKNTASFHLKEAIWGGRRLKLFQLTMADDSD
jgi:hypothetical protein